MSPTQDLATLDYRRWSMFREQAHKPEGPQGEVIALSATLGSWGDAVGQRAAELLGLGYWDRDIVRDVARAAALVNHHFTSRRYWDAFERSKEGSRYVVARSGGGDVDGEGGGVEREGGKAPSRERLAGRRHHSSVSRLHDPGRATTMASTTPGSRLNPSSSSAWW